MIGPSSLAALPGAIGNRCFPDAPLREVVRQSAVSFGTRVAGLAVAFLASVLLARALGASDFGAYAIALGWASVLAIPARLGLDNVALRFVTIYREGRNPGLLRGFLRASAFSIAAASAILGALVVAAGFVVGPGHADPALVVAVALLIPAMAALGWLSAVIRSFQRIFASQAYEQLFRPTILIVLLGAAWASGLSLDAPKAMWMTVVAIALPLALLAHHVRREAAALGPAQADGSDRRMWMAVGWPLLLLSIFQEAGNQIDLILIGILNDSTSAAHFAAAMRLASLASLGLVAIVTVSGPMIASAFHRKDDATLARLATVTARISLLFAVVLVTGLLIFGRVALGAFGPSFPAAYPALAVLCLGALVNAFTGSVG
jgi:O-antigen/teichoic acid export membrane protein